MSDPWLGGRSVHSLIPRSLSADISIYRSLQKLSVHAWNWKGITGATLTVVELQNASKDLSYSAMGAQVRIIATYRGHLSSRFYCPPLAQVSPKGPCVGCIQSISAAESSCCRLTDVIDAPFGLYVRDIRTPVRCHRSCCDISEGEANAALSETEVGQDRQLYRFHFRSWDNGSYPVQSYNISSSNIAVV